MCFEQKHQFCVPKLRDNFILVIGTEQNQSMVDCAIFHYGCNLLSRNMGVVSRVFFPTMLFQRVHFFFMVLYRIRVSQDDTAALLYSSGTTGMSKGVAITHGNFISCICIFNSGVDEFLSPDQNLLLVLPMFHVYGLAICTVASLGRGITVIVLPQFDFVKMLTAIQTYRITHVPLVPPIIIGLAKQDIVLKFDLSSLVQIGSGAAPLGKDIMDMCAKRFPNVAFKQVLMFSCLVYFISIINSTLISLEFLFPGC